MGNHDLMYSNAMTMYYSSKPNYVFKVKDMVFVVVDGVKEYFPSSNGYFKTQELK